ncbi:uncharacterized protein LOC120628842 isoform X3 [Pararge aegeria]|uniref:uncharacterized protein LOC120628842 isoform X3 n=1 Tax=Pararge aegeria TaxID=116150 RepID=UPI0019CFF845|nr:uncharacterized protein LOC120628842 isoform X3 [Pararge aegeria]XP_039753411.1 uncharacterized protein LOC120628842 isoform X3 [Pararge aegeria]XP_039753412.1 uncharacterized protein LOC120628842 isoform X3 [Pararge aegeria]
MSEGDVSLIRDEDVLRRMWQQTEDFSRKKEIRAHMYRLREERLRNLYSPEPGDNAKGCEFTTQGHVKSFADQNFQSMKSKEVRDASSPTKEFTYRGQDLKDLSNAGWNVESENKTTDGGRTQVKSVHANIEGRYDVDGGQGQFTAVDFNKQATTDYDDGKTSLKRNENVSNTAAHEQVVRKTKDGEHSSSTTSSSTSTSKFEKVSSTHEAVPYQTYDDYDEPSRKSYNTNRNDEVTSQKYTKQNTTEYDQNLKNDFSQGELVSRKVDYPDDNTKVIVETRCLPDGTRVTSTRREFRAPSVQTSRSEQYQTRTENKSYETSQKRSQVNETSKTIHESIDARKNIVDSQKIIDDNDFKKNQIYSENKIDEHEKNIENQRKVESHTTVDDYDYITKKDNLLNKNDDYEQTMDQYKKQRTHEVNVKETNRREVTTTSDEEKIRHRYIDESLSQKDTDERVHDNTRGNIVVEKTTNTDQYQSTYQTDFTQRKISNDLSPAHQAWASTLRSDTPTKPSTRASSPGSKTFKSSTSSLRSSVSPDKTYRKPLSRGESPDKFYRKPSSRGESPDKSYRTPLSRGDSPDKSFRKPVSRGESPDKVYKKPFSRGESPDKTIKKPTSRGGSPNKFDRHSPSRNVISNKCSIQSTFVTESKIDTHSSSEERSQETRRPRLSPSSEKTPHRSRPSSSPENKPNIFDNPRSPTKSIEKTTTPQRWNSSPVDGRSVDITKLRSTSPKQRSPDRIKSDVQRELFKSDDSDYKYPKSVSPTRSLTEPLQRNIKNLSPTRNVSTGQEDTTYEEPGYMKPTATSKLSDDFKLSSRLSPTKQLHSKTSEQKSKSTINKVSDEHYTFIDEETKMYSRSDNDLVHTIQKPTNDEFSSENFNNKRDMTESHQLAHHDSPSPDIYSKKRPSSPSKSSPVVQRGLNEDFLRSKQTPMRNISPEEESPDDYSPDSYPQKRPSLPSKNRYSPVKDTHPTVTENKAKKLPDSPDRKRSPTKDGLEKSEPVNKSVDDIPTLSKTSQFSERMHAPETVNTCHSKEPSPSKLCTYDRKSNTYEEEIKHSASITDKSTEQLKVKTHSVTLKPSLTPTNKSLRNSTSPVKSLRTDSKYKLTSDFISTEKTKEDINKTTPKERPRQLITPSTSPTRKPKNLDEAPSSGLSSPTTSVSGFVYYKSPAADKTIVTDLDEQDLNTEFQSHEQPNDSYIKGTPSPKMPCRSPSPEKRPTKETLPRKSSLKKSSITQTSPTEKPPSSFNISPNIETKEFTEHKVQIKDQPKEDKDKPVKIKPPFERRETYEERCRKILGMIEKDTTETESVSKKNITSTKNLETTVSSPSVSPCRSPSPGESLLVIKNNNKITETTNRNDFLSQETENINQTTISLSNITDSSVTNKIKTSSRDSSPTKLQDITLPYEDKRSFIKNTRTDSTKSSPTREIIKNKPSEPNNHMPHVPRIDSSPGSTPNMKNLTPSLSTYESSKQKDKQLITSVDDSQTTPVDICTEIPKNEPQRHHESPTRQSPETFPKSNIKSSTSESSPSLSMKQTNPDVSIIKSDMQYTTETDHRAHVKDAIDVIEDETDYIPSATSLKPSRKIPSEKASPLKNIETRACNTTILTKNSEYNTDFIVSEKETEDLDRAQKSPRNLSPNRSEKSRTDKKSPLKSTSLLKKEVVSENIKTQITRDTTTENETITSTEKQSSDKVRDQKNAIRPPSRNVSPTKKSSNISPAQSRSISPKKPQSPTDRPQSPQVTKVSGIKPRDNVPSHIRKPSPNVTSPTKTEKSTTVDVKKLNTTIKQSSFIKSSINKVSSNKITQGSVSKEQEPKKTVAPKGTKDNVKKDVEIKVTRTASEISLRTKKTSPQRIRSKPEIQVNDKVTKNPTLTTKYNRCSPKDSQTKLPTNKPKSATALNTSTDEDDVIIDVQQAKSSRENSPDRICPTPVGFSEDVGTPRFPDEVNEPDDDFHSRTHQTIHETESIVDDIVEINEDDELFVKKMSIDDFKDKDECLLSLNDKVSKFNTNVEKGKKKEDTTRFKDTERKIHTDFIDENLKSDHCLLSVSEKVNKFAKGPIETKEKSPSRNIVEEYDKHTTYQDDYTKLSVNDKAHLFIETAENVKSTKTKPVQKIERPDLSSVDDALKSDDCLLSVSDKVNKFVKTAEQFLNETLESEEKEKKIREQHEKIMKKIVENQNNNTENENIIEDIENTLETKYNSNLRQNSFAKETASSSAKIKDVTSSTTKLSDKTSTTKITTLRSSEAVKKAKALFENIGSVTAPKTKEEPKPKEVLNIKTKKTPDTSFTQKTPKTIAVNTRRPSIDNDIPKCDDVEHTLVSQKVSLKYNASETQDDKPRSSPTRFRPQSPDSIRSRSPYKVKETSTAITTATSSADLPTQARPNLAKSEKAQEKMPGYQKPTKTSQLKEETKVTDEIDVSSRRGSGKFGVELRRTSIERTTVSNERRRSSVEHYQPCIEDIFDLDLLEQMLEKVVGYEQRRRIRAQIRVARKKTESEHVNLNTLTRNKQTATKTTKIRSPERQSQHKSPERSIKPAHHQHSPERHPKHFSQKSATADLSAKQPPQMPLTSEHSHPKENKPMLNGHAKETTVTSHVKDIRSHSPNKLAPKAPTKSKSPLRPSSPDKKTRPVSPTKTATPKPKSNRFSEYASAYMKKVGLNETEQNNISNVKVKKAPVDQQTSQRVESRHIETKYSKTTSKNITERTSSKDNIETIYINGKRSPSPQRSILESESPPPQKKVDLEEKRFSPERKAHSPDRKPQTPVSNTHGQVRKGDSPERKAYSPSRKIHSPDRKAHSPDRKVPSPDRSISSPDHRTHSPAGVRNLERHTQKSPDRLNTTLGRQKSDSTKSKKETTVKTVYEIEKKIPPKQKPEEKPSWVTNRNLKKITSETRTFSAKKVEPEKPKYRSTSPSKIISKPLDVITSSYGPGPLDADGRPLFGIKALRNGASNYQVKGTVIRQEFHSRNGSEPEGTVSVTAYSTEPQDLEKLLQTQGEKPSRILHGLAAITTTKKFGGDTGTTLSAVNNKEERAALDQFTHSHRRITESTFTSGSNPEDRRELLYTQEENAVNIDSVVEDRYAENRTERIESNNRKNTNDYERRVLKDRKTETKDNKQNKKLQEKPETRVEMETVGRRGNEKTERTEKRLDERKTVRQSSVKSLTEKYIKSASETSKSERVTYPKAGLILRTSTMKDSISSDSSTHAGLARSDSEHSLASADDVVTTTTTEQVDDGVRTTSTTTSTRSHGRMQERSFLDSSSKVTGVQDILTRMKNADIVIEDGDSSADTEARALLNKFLGATVLMAGMQNYVTEKPTGKVVIKQETVQSSGGKVTSGRHFEELDIDQCWDERVLRKLLDECTDYEQRRRLRARLRTLMAEQEACASAVTSALAAAGECADSAAAGEREEEEVTTVTSSVRRNSSEKTVSSSTTIKNSKVIESMTRPAPKPVSPFAKFRQLEKQNSTNSPNNNCGYE